MFKKISSKVLIIVLIVLMAIYLVVRFTGSNDRTFKEKVLDFDMASVTQILVSDPKNMDQAVDLRFTGDKWVVKVEGVDYPADSNTVSGVLKQLSNLPTKRFAGKGKDIWAKYELTDTIAPRITLKAGSKIVADLYIGKFSYNMPKGTPQQLQSRQQQRGETTTFVRLADDKDVYAVDGFLKMSIGSNVDAYRMRALTNVVPTDITRIEIGEQGISKVIEKQDGRWTVNGQPADSAQMARFSSTLARLTGSMFVNEKPGQTFPSHTMKIEGNNFNPVEVQAFPVADTNISFIISSSANPGTYFNGREGGLFKKIWQDHNELLGL